MIKMKIRNTIFPKTDNLPRSHFTEKLYLCYGCKLSLSRFSCKKKKEDFLLRISGKRNQNR